MVMNGITFLVLAFYAQGVLSNVEEPKIPFDCGYTPEFAAPQVVGGQPIDPDVYSWMASLRYESTRDGVCGGSVINSRYVLTAAHCVDGQKIIQHGRLTGVRLGDFSKESCDYGTFTCLSYLHFGIAHIKKHERYQGGRVIHNDIALIRVSERIPFDDKLKPICLPYEVSRPVDGDVFTVCGWGTTMTPAENVTKRAAGVPIVTDLKQCPHKSPSRMCAGKLSNNIFTSQTSCDGDSGGPLMKQCDGGKMAIIGIVSFGNPACVNEFVATHYTRVSYFLSWIEANMQMP